MNRARCVLAIDQGTTSTRCIVFDENARPLGLAQREFKQHYPASGWVEHDAEDIWRDALATARAAISQSGAGPTGIAAIGITNQRETTVVWERESGIPIHRAIVWQDRRTADVCAQLKRDGAEELVQARTGLLLDPYFSATKVAWILDQVPGARDRAGRGELAFGTIDSFLLWRLTAGKVHATDATNASRTLLFDIHRQQWDEELLRLFRVPRSLLPEVRDSSEIYGITAAGMFAQPIPIAGIAGDQQAALFGQACFAPGMAKSTYGTGCFMLLNTGEQAIRSNNRLLTTTAYRLKGRTTYALEGSIFVAGAAIKWLRDGLGHITHASQTDQLARSLKSNHGVYLVPAFVGLGAPHWRPDARGLICGLTLDVTGAHLVRAALESVAYQTLDLCEAMTRDGAERVRDIRIDGGMAANDWFCQFLADVLGATVERPRELETTAL
ncbi:MAG TPA: glycerol kinase GlpK, partial [Steroidobacteraceae bacterium]|nr:glycerol kinase GlpK [Steroidobacteraceae bacterium]